MVSVVADQTSGSRHSKSLSVSAQIDLGLSGDNPRLIPLVGLIVLVLKIHEFQPLKVNVYSNCNVVASVRGVEKLLMFAWVELIRENWT